MKRRIVVLCSLMLVLAGCSSSTPSDIENTVDKVIEAIDNSDKIDNFDSVIYTKETDPLELMGKKGQYIGHGRTSVKVTNIYHEENGEEIKKDEDGFINIEMFENEGDLDNRFKFIKSTISMGTTNLLVVKTKNYLVMYPETLDKDVSDEIFKIIESIETKKEA